ncbi:TPA_exp: Uncharacterized protein A8136_3678 [Trichophyton benhamiae CBS 112371]|uniref:Peptidase metallopeptidase domain-containing protein n=1 Tax=Arthroderma benhamiae (strain ATCC MYA-4681 / CBS 112371) TaxID=663331 RepID=D4B157_ARTBC|nr:uncharacterized protein ARB_02186 [Trichophyton benhamiae CBS 112371]EFE30992.1 hypothetical protein ARB_02186 [Trichophyton benhamiae CBS 112371]DAA74180.1 TPA_exp: Uncharacterized protein A8136_3678 [Trichophyton benhamiae CBS 112371]
MAIKVILIFFCYIFASTLNAGHPLWEYSQRDIKANNASHPLAKRWATINPNLGTFHLWPDKTVRFVFEDKKSKQALGPWIVAAMEIWYAAGLPRDFKMTEVSEKTMKKERANVLVVKFTTKPALYATPAIPPKDEKNGIKGPTMLLNIRNDVGMLDIGANIAHEIGHVFGLLHEHQIPAFWGTPGHSESLFKFNCENLQDYQKVTKGLSASEIEKACTDRATAIKLRFSASEYLPIRSTIMRTPRVPAVPTADDVDWDSIMIYPSGSGAASPDGTGPENDLRKSVLLKANGDKIKPNLAPSDQDVNALITLYDVKFNTPQPKLLNDPSHPDYSKFKEESSKNTKC